MIRNLTEWDEDDKGYANAFYNKACYLAWQNKIDIAL